ncbi:MAG: TonB-dependent receptor plug domain-containing protein, partial [Woeseia sp.]
MKRSLHQDHLPNIDVQYQAEICRSFPKLVPSNALLAIAIGLLSAGAAAQTSGNSSGDTLEEVVVTASRIARSGFEAPTPVTVIGSETLERAAVTNVAEYLNELPAIRPSTTPGNTGISTTNAGTFFMNLRGLGNQRTLVLVNKRRHVPTTPEGMVDLNVIPNALIERIEMVTGGASAAWGSDAVAGVVNVILDEDITGLKSTIQYGESELGDAEDFRFSLAGGIEFAGGRGH